jgi:hypothetical protein
MNRGVVLRAIYLEREPTCSKGALFRIAAALPLSRVRECLYFSVIRAAGRGIWSLQSAKRCRMQ